MRGHLGPRDLCLNKLGDHRHAMLYIKFQASEERGSEKEDFFNIFLCISMVQRPL